MNSYEEKQEAKKQRYSDRAEQARQEYADTYAQARRMASVIPFGQPILVGHHSEKRDRNYRDKIHRTFGKAFHALDKAAHYEEKADAVGSGGISSDDPDALEKLRSKLADMERNQETMKAANAAIRRNKTQDSRAAALVALGFTENQAQELLKPDYMGRIGYAAFSLTNNGSNMRRVKERIAILEKAAQRKTKEEENPLYTYREDTEENRVMFLFDGKPSVEIRAVLKSQGFKWSPSRGAWVRFLNGNGIYAAERVKNQLSNMNG